MSPGDTVWIPGTGPAHDKDRSHLYVIITEPCENGFVLAVPICTIRTSKYDKTCELKLGDHDFIEYPSYVAYYHVTRYKAEQLEKQIHGGALHADEPVKQEVLKRIRDGISSSRQIPPVEKKYFIDQIAQEEKSAAKKRP